MKILFIGFHEEGKYCIPKLYEKGYSVKAILTLNKKEILKRSGAFDYSNQSKEYNIPIYKIKHINSNKSKNLRRDNGNKYGTISVNYLLD